MSFTEKLKHLIEEYPSAEVKAKIYDVDTYTTGNIKDVYINRLALYYDEWNGTGNWIDKDDYEEVIYDTVSEQYYDQTEEFIDEKVQEEMEKLEFKEFIFIIIGN